MRQKLKIVLAVALALALSAMLAAAPAAALPPDKLADKVKDSLMLAITKWSGTVVVSTSKGLVSFRNITSYSSCTAWFATADGYAVTAGHCVDPAQPEVKQLLVQELLDKLVEEGDLTAAEAKESLPGLLTSSQVKDVTATMTVLQSPGPNSALTSPVTAQVVGFESFDKSDTAVLKVAGVTNAKPLTLAGKPPRIGTPLMSAGYKGVNIALSDPSRIPGASFEQGSATSVQVDANGVTHTETSAQLIPGMSGGPTTDMDGAVFGINSYTVSSSGTPSAYYITDGENLRRYLNSLGIRLPSPSSAARKTTKKDGPSKMLMVIVAGGIAGLAVLTLIVVMVARRRRPAPMPPAWPLQPSVGPGYGAPGQPSSAPPIGVGTPPQAAPPVSPPLWPLNAPPAQSSCGHQGNNPGARFCGTCGEPLPSQPLWPPLPPSA